ncbi:MAG: hypothetical protein ACPL07_02955 [Candidatus Bathyarchaeia archaeon]
MSFTSASDIINYVFTNNLDELETKLLYNGSFYTVYIKRKENSVFIALEPADKNLWHDLINAIPVNDCTRT